MPNIAEQLLADKTRQGISTAELAGRLHKDISTVQNQLSLRNPKNLTIATAQEYAAALGGEVSYISAGVKQALESDGIRTMQHRFAELGNQLEYLKEKLTDKDDQIRGLRGGIELRDQQLLLKDSKISILREDLERKEKIIGSKTDMIDDLHRQIIALQEQLIQVLYTRNSRISACAPPYPAPMDD